MKAPILIGHGNSCFHFAVGVLGMLHVDVLADSYEGAVDHLSDPACVEEFPSELREELIGTIYVPVLTPP